MKKQILDYVDMTILIRVAGGEGCTEISDTLGIAKQTISDRAKRLERFKLILIQETVGKKHAHHMYALTTQAVKMLRDLRISLTD